MQTELQITLHDMTRSAALDARIRARVAKLEKLFSRVTGCRVTISAPHRHQRTHRPHAVTLNVAYPGGEVVVTREGSENVYVLLRDAFSAAERELEKAAGQRGRRAATRHAIRPGRMPVTKEAHRE
jgi:ribosomal subunit interface protein